MTGREIESVIGSCRRHGYAFVGLDDFRAAPEGSAVLIADDGHRGAITWLLRKAPALRISAMAFVVSGWIDFPQALPAEVRTSDIAIWDQVGVVRRAGYQTISTTVPGVNDPQDCRTGFPRRHVLRRDRPALGLPPGWVAT